MGQLLPTNGDKCLPLQEIMCTLTDVSLQIFAVYFDPIWKPDAVVVESKVVGSLL